MNSKKALKIISNEFNTYYRKILDEEFKTIRKDLELLEIIKKHIVDKNFEYGSDFDNYNKISFTAEIMQLKDFTDKSNGLHYTTFKVDNGFEKVKEWLYNDK